MNQIDIDALAIYKPPFKYQAGYIFDADDNMVADDCGENAAARIRGWGRIQYMNNPEQLQDTIGEHIAKAMTEYWEKHRQE